MLGLVTLLQFCAPAEKTSNTDLPFDFSKPEKLELPGSLQEISGITFKPGKNDTIFAVQDEDGIVFQLTWDGGIQRHTQFTPKGDFEDITIINGQTILLKSNGQLNTFPEADLRLNETKRLQEWKKVIPKEEYEGMYGDAVTNKIYVLCKKCEPDNAEKKITGYILDTTQPENTPVEFKISVKDFPSFNNQKQKGFKPSALTKNQKTNEWYILSSINNLLVITDDQWNWKESIELNPEVFNQPEGITFDADGNLYISNEGTEQLPGNILKFKQNQVAH